jgi:hypothetical protein
MFDSIGPAAGILMHEHASPGVDFRYGLLQDIDAGQGLLMSEFCHNASATWGSNGYWLAKSNGSLAPFGSLYASGFLTLHDFLWLAKTNGFLVY